MSIERYRRAHGSFNTSINDAVQLVLATQAAMNSTGSSAFTARQQKLITEYGLVLLLNGLETFLETTFVLNLAGVCGGVVAPSQRKIKVASTVPQARAVIIGDQPYISWNNPDKVCERAKTWFPRGEPFVSVLVASSTMLHYMRHCRNVVAHDSPTAWNKFRNRTRSLYGAVPSALSVGGVLSAAPCPDLTTFNKSSLFEEAVETFRAVGANLTSSRAKS